MEPALTTDDGRRTQRQAAARSRLDGAQLDDKADVMADSNMRSSLSGFGAGSAKPATELNRAEIPLCYILERRSVVGAVSKEEFECPGALRFKFRASLAPSPCRTDAQSKHQTHPQVSGSIEKSDDQMTECTCQKKGVHLRGVSFKITMG